MKFITRFLSLSVLVAAAILYAGCDGGGEDTKSEQQLQLEALVGAWTLTSAELDGDPRTTDFPNMKLTLSGSFVDPATDLYTYSITGTTPTPSPIPRSGKWKFGANVKTQIIRDPGTINELPTNYTLSGTTLTLTFDCEECDFDGGSRVSSVNGEWVMVFTK
jgi:hypothetical protein